MSSPGASEARNAGASGADRPADEVGLLDQPAEPVARRGWRQWVRYAFVAAVVVALVVLLWRERHTVAGSLRSVSPGILALSLLFGVVGAGLPGVVWRDLLRSQGYPTAPVAGLRAFFVSQLGKYLPGGVWNLVAQVSMARDLRIPGRQGATSTLLALALSVITSMLVAGLTLPFAFPQLLARYWWVFAVVPALLVLLLPRSVRWWTGTAFRLLRRPGRPVVLGARDLLRASLLLVGSWLALGVHFWLLVHSIGMRGTTAWLLSTGVFALAWVAGFLVVIAPAGAGVREAVLVLGCAAFLPAGPVLAMAVLSRVLLVVADILLAALFLGAAFLGAAWNPAGRRRSLHDAEQPR